MKRFIDSSSTYQSQCKRNESSQLIVTHWDHIRQIDQPCTHIFQLGNYIYIEIFQLLSLVDRCKVRRVCNRWRQIVDSLHVERLAIHFFSAPIQISLQSSSPSSSSARRSGKQNAIEAENGLSVCSLRKLPSFVNVSNLQCLVLNLYNFTDTLTFDYPELVQLKQLEILDGKVIFPSNFQLSTLHRLMLNCVCQSSHLFVCFPNLQELHCFADTLLFTSEYSTTKRAVCLQTLCVPRFANQLNGSQIDELAPNLRTLKIGFVSANVVESLLQKLISLESLTLVCLNLRNLWSSSLKLGQIVDRRVHLDIRFENELNYFESRQLQQTFRRLQSSFEPIGTRVKLNGLDLDNIGEEQRSFVGIKNLFLKENEPIVRENQLFNDECHHCFTNIQRLRYQLKDENLLPDVLKRMSNCLQSIEFTCCTLTEKAIRQVARLVPCLKVLHISYESCTKTTTKTTFDLDCLMEFRSLESLRIYDVGSFLNTHSLLPLIQTNFFLSKLYLGMFDFEFDWTPLAKILLERSCRVLEAEFELAIIFRNRKLNRYSIESIIDMHDRNSKLKVEVLFRDC